MLRRAWFLVATILLAGCAAPFPEGALPTARTLLPYAEKEAVSWDPQARLMGVFAWENPPQDKSEDWPTGHDDRVGDGRSHAWGYLFASERTPGTLLSLTVDADGRIIDRDLDDEGEFWPNADAKPIRDWRLDSDQALDRAGTDDKWRDATRHDDSSVFMVLLKPEGEPPHWALFASGGDKAATVVVNATDGRVASGPDWLMGRWMPPMAEGMIEYRTVLGVGGESILSFPIRAKEHPELLVRVTTAAGLPIDRLNITLEGPEHRVHREMTPRAGASERITIQGPDPGDWTVRLRLEQGAAGQVEIAWCATGMRWFAMPGHGCTVA